MNFFNAAFSALKMAKNTNGTLYLKKNASLELKYKDCELEIQEHSKELYQMVISKLYEPNEEEVSYDEYIVLLSPEINLNATSGGFTWVDEQDVMVFMTKDTEILGKLQTCISSYIRKDKLDIPSVPSSIDASQISGDVIFSATAQLFAFNVKDALFEPISDKEVLFEILKSTTKLYYLKISGEHNCCTQISSAINPYFSQEKWCFLWNQLDKVLVSLAAVFDPNSYNTLRGQLQRILINQQDLGLTADESDYVQSYAVAEDMAIDSGSSSEEEEEQQTISQYQKSKGKLSKLATAMKQYKAFVIRGNAIDVYNTDKQAISHQTQLNFNYTPDHLQLHDNESKLITSNNDNISMMDIEKNKVVQSWDAPKSLKSLSTYHKVAQTTGESLFYGITKDRVILMDPRLKNLIANDTSYKSKIDFTCISTNNENEIAVGNEQGELKLYNALGMRAKTNLKLGGIYYLFREIDCC